MQAWRALMGIHSSVKPEAFNTEPRDSERLQVLPFHVLPVKLQGCTGGRQQLRFCHDALHVPLDHQGEPSGNGRPGLVMALRLLDLKSLHICYHCTYMT